MRGTRAQIFTLEGVLAALIVLAGLAFALQAVVVTPSSSGDSGAPADVGRLDSVLDQAAQDGSLKRAVLAWNGSASGFDNASNGNYYVGDFPPNRFGNATNETFGPATTVNVRVYYETGSGRSNERLVYNGIPGDGAIRSTATVPVYDYDLLRNASGAPQTPRVTVESGNFYVDNDQYSGSDLYAVVEVEVIVWEA